MQLVTDHLVGKIGFQQLCKQTANHPSVNIEMLNEDHRQSYFLQCKEAIEPAFDLLNRIREKQLYLEEYKLNVGHCKGLMNACKIEPELITHITLDNCGLSDESLTLIFRGLLYQKKIVKITLKRLEI